LPRVNLRPALLVVIGYSKPLRLIEAFFAVVVSIAMMSGFWVSIHGVERDKHADARRWLNF
jgi:hypothetical protein